MPSIENKIYYYPYYCYRHFPDMESGLVDLLNKTTQGEKIGIYQNLENAAKAGNEMLCDDDTFGVLIIDLTRGFVKVAEHPREQPWIGKIISMEFRKFLEIRD